MTVVPFEKLKERQLLIKELAEWRRRLQLCMEFDWKDPSESICKSEVERLRKLVEGEDIITRMSRLG